MTLTKSDFDNFRTRIYNPDSQAGTMAPPVQTRSAAEDFRRSVKRDKSHYLVFKEDKQWDSWKRSTISTARAHGCEDVFNPTYTPQGAAARELFNEKQKFIYSVFESVLKTDMGKYFVRQHESDYNAQAIFRKLKQHALSSTQASLDSSTLLTYLTSARLDSKWRGTAHAFILNWCDKLRTYEDMLPIGDHFSEGVKLNLLQNTVAGVDELNQVKLQSAHDVAHGQRALCYEQYKTLLLSAATAYDAKHGLSKPCPSRQVQEHSQHPPDSFDFDQPQPEHQIFETDTLPSFEASVHSFDRRFNIDTNIPAWNAFAASSSRPSPRPVTNDNRPPHMSGAKWYSLSEQDRSTWDSKDSRSTCRESSIWNLFFVLSSQHSG